MAEVYLNLGKAIGSVLVVIATGFVGRKYNYMLPEHESGMANFLSKVSLPVAIGLGIANLDFFQLDIIILVTTILAKLTMFLSVAFIILMTKSGRDKDAFLHAGMFGLFAAMSNDVAIGVVIIEAVFPGTNFGSNVFLASLPGAAVIQPLSLVFIEIGRKGGKLPKNIKFLFDIGKNLLSNPIFSCVIVGVIISLFGALWSPVLEIAALWRPLAGAFTGLSLFYMGFLLSNTALTNESIPAGKVFLKAFLLCLAKLVISPMVFYLYCKLLGGSEDQKNFSYLYGQIPAPPGIIATAFVFDIEIPIVTLGIVMCHVLSIPLLYITTVYSFISCQAKQITLIVTSYAFDSINIVMFFSLAIFTIATRFEYLPSSARIRLIVYGTMLLGYFYSDLVVNIVIHGNPFESVPERGGCYMVQCDDFNVLKDVVSTFRLFFLISSTIWAFLIGIDRSFLPMFIMSYKKVLSVICGFLGFGIPLIAMFFARHNVILSFGPSFIDFTSNCDFLSTIVWTSILGAISLFTILTVFIRSIIERRRKDRLWDIKSKIESSRDKESTSLLSEDENFSISNESNKNKTDKGLPGRIEYEDGFGETISISSKNSLTSENSQGQFKISTAVSQRKKKYFLKESKIIMLMMVMHGLAGVVNSIYYLVIIMSDNQEGEDNGGIAFIATALMQWTGMIYVIMIMSTEKSTAYLHRRFSTLFGRRKFDASTPLRNRGTSC